MQVLNILKQTAKDIPGTLTSVSMTNTEYGVCPKCKHSMSFAKNHNNDKMYFCGDCKVTLPIEN